MVESQKEAKNIPQMEKMFKAGAHFGFAKARRHPSTKPYIFGVKNKVEIFDLEKTSELLESAKNFLKKIANEGGQILFVGGKSEAREAIKSAGESLSMPYVSGRWIGGTLTNFSEIRKRIEKMLDLISKKEKGELAKFTKKERLLMDREVEKLKTFFSGIVNLKGLPKALFVVDLKKEHIAVSEAKKMKVPVVSISGSDCDLSKADFPIPANDASISSVRYFVNEIAQAVREGSLKSEKKV